MVAKQLTVFIENRTGRLSEVLSVLKHSNVSILSMSLADTTEYGLLRLIVDAPEYGLLRLIVDAPEKGKDTLNENGFSSLVSEVSIVKIPHKAGSLYEILDIIDDKDLGIEYMYGLSIGGEDAYVVLKASDITALDSILKENGVDTVSHEDLLSM